MQCFKFQKLIIIQQITQRGAQMSRLNENMRKIQAEKSQLRSILSDFRKAKHKCITLYEELKAQFNNRAEFEAVEKQVVVKLELLDAPGLVQLKNKLVKFLSELFDLEAELNTQKERIAARKQFSKLANTGETGRNQGKQSKNLTLQPYKPKSKRMPTLDENPTESNTTTGSNASTGKNEKIGVTNIPIYHITDDCSETKVERITKFVAALKSKQQKQVGNMVMHSEQNSAHKIKEILEEDPEYKAMKEEVEKLRQEKEQLQAQIKGIADKAVQQFIDKAHIVEECDNYKIIRVYKSSAPNRQGNGKNIIDKPRAQPQRNQSSSGLIVKQMEIQAKAIIKTRPAQAEVEDYPTRRLKIEDLQKQINSIRQKRKDTQIIELQKQLQKDHQESVQAVVSRISSTLESNQNRLKKLREQRIKIFEKQQDVWSQLQNV